MSLISPNFDVKLIIFPNLARGLFPKLLEKALSTALKVKKILIKCAQKRGAHLQSMNNHYESLNIKE